MGLARLAGDPKATQASSTLTQEGVVKRGASQASPSYIWLRPYSCLPSEADGDIAARAGRTLALATTGAIGRGIPRCHADARSHTG
jgi:hypothetical protein